MSVMRMLTRMCAVSALRGQTWADKRVYDSDNTPLSQALMLNESAKPYIVVFTDADNYIEQNGTDLYGMRREMNLVLEIGVASKVVGKTGSNEIRIPLTDEGMELALDMVENQAISCLFGDPQNDWGELLKEFVLRVERVSGQRGASSDRDRRWAARQLGVVCDIISDLPSGVPVPEDHPIRNFIEMAAKHPEANMDAASEICTAIISDKGAPEWLQVQAMMGVRRLALRASGIAPLSSELPIFATAHGEDLTDRRGEAPILRKIGADDFDWVPDELVGLTEEKTISTNVMDVKVKDKPDKVVSDGETE